MDRENMPLAVSPEDSAALSAEARLLEQLGRGDAGAGHQFVRDYYPGVACELRRDADDPRQDLGVCRGRGLRAED